MSKSQFAPSLFDAFNARALEPHQVAKTFVPSSHFTGLARQAHSLIVGPRGSGKTTLLKMLLQPALEAWSHPDAERFRAAIDFSGVFIATDISWREQIRSLGNGVIDEKHSVFLSQAAFTTHLLRALAASFEFRAGRVQVPSVMEHRRVDLSSDSEALLVRELATSWRLKPVLATLLGLKSALGTRLVEIRDLASKESLLGEEGRSERFAETPFLHLDFLHAAGQAVDLFDGLTSSGCGRWALLFDELELAPTWILDKLVTSLRSVNEKFIFKLSMSPFSKDLGAFQNAFAAMADNDYDVLQLWYAHKESGYEFCEAILSAMLKERGLPPMSPEDVFGRSEFETPREEWAASGSAYHSGSRLQRRFARMAAKDHSFRSYLDRKGIDVDFKGIPSGDERASDIRKITSIVLVRDEFRASDVTRAKIHRQTIRSRKNPTLYAGAKALFAMSEGNPRWLIGIIGRLLSEGGFSGEAIDVKRQSTVVLNSTHRFRALLRTIPGPSLHGSRTGRGLLSLLDKIGEFFFDVTVVGDFNPEPPGSFTVDARASPDVMDGLGRALNAGAIVYVPDEASGLVLGSLRGKRFRLSYLLAPYYQLPLTLGKPVALSSTIAAQQQETPLLEGLDEPAHE